MLRRPGIECSGGEGDVTIVRHALCAFGIALCASGASAAEREPCASTDPLRRPFFGDTHVHTAYSFDASSQDTRNTPRDAYRFA